MGKSVFFIMTGLMLCFTYQSAFADFNECSQKCDQDYPVCMVDVGRYEHDNGDNKDELEPKYAACKTAQDACWEKCSQGTDNTPKDSQDKQPQPEQNK